LVDAMTDFTFPGVFVEELPSIVKAIDGVPTSTAAFVGEAERGPLQPELVTSLGEYQRRFGGFWRTARYLPHAVAGFFHNGGKRLYVSRVVGRGATTGSRTHGPLTVESVGPGEWGRRVWIRILPGSKRHADGRTMSFHLRVAYWSTLPSALFDPFDDATTQPRPQLQELFENLSVDPSSPDYFVARLFDADTQQSRSALVDVRASDAATGSVPKPTAGDLLDPGCGDGAPLLDDGDFIGQAIDSRSQVQGLSALDDVAYRAVSIVHAPYPGSGAMAIARAVVGHCERTRRFAVVDVPPVDPAMVHPRDPVDGVGETRFAACYAPWLEIADPSNVGGTLVVPPGGHLAGIYARVDEERGVAHAPANELVQGVRGATFAVSDAQQQELAARGLNSIRLIPERGVRVWSARTLSESDPWQYVNVRRLLIFIEQSIDQGMRWVTFEPNGERLWARVEHAVRLFLGDQWRRAALLGRTENEAFFVAVNRTTMTEDDILNGRLVIEIGVAPVRPAEFVIIRIGLWTADRKPPD
jgi:phage tail sheath protein FI